jgi:hypothetical protein
MKKEMVLKLLQTFEDEGWDSIEPIFHSFDKFYKYLKLNGVQDELTLNNIPDGLVNNYSLILFNENPDKFLDYVIDKQITDVHKKDDGYYLRLRDRSEVAEFFHSGGRGYSSRDIVERIMNDDDWWEPYYDTTDDVYRDVIEELTPENLKYLKERVVSDLKDVEIKINSQSSEEMELIASEQGHDDHLFVTPENIDRIVDDEETMNYLLDNELDDVKSNLYSIHSSAYNSAYIDEIWKKVKNELSTYFDPDFHTETLKMGDKTKYVEYIKINDFPGIIKDFLTEYSDNEWDSDTLAYYGSFTGVLTKMMDELGSYDYLDFHIPDYPDHRLVDTNINDMFYDYF